jgi:hypothetical protein
MIPVLLMEAVGCLVAHSRKLVSKALCKVFDSFCFLMVRCLWFRGNSRVFRNCSLTIDDLVDSIDSQLMYAMGSSQVAP